MDAANSGGRRRVRWLGPLLATLLLGSLASALGNALADELRDCAPWLAGRLLKRAVRFLPEPEQERYEEEWTAILDDVPGRLAKLFKAAGFAIYAPFAARAARGQPPISYPLTGWMRFLPGLFYRSPGLALSMLLVSVLVLAVVVISLVHDFLQQVMKAQMKLVELMQRLGVTAPPQPNPTPLLVGGLMVLIAATVVVAAFWLRRQRRQHDS